ncbi:DUF4142 domain-containing protein [Pedobacter petrophilus]|uniref:DUF4142 domain-containing protein n=1 Tax=Pedobacter petrophilus TaxID=1908241 RepID=A0A7K0G3Y8_9SPHI|nr:DUF4142 domain-containing protein [Pedobacter petrophilus]MRX78528.1 DUF4142 domain-containing protein [Pedobacter petrophilus]
MIFAAGAAIRGSILSQVDALTQNADAAEQETIGKILKDMNTAVRTPGKEGKALLSKLQEPNGAAFDKAFMRGQVDTH